jgi:hypothetical protein
VSLLLLPAVISLRNNTTARFSIAGVCLVILVIAIAFSKRSGGAIGDEIAISYEQAGDKDAPSDLIHADVAEASNGGHARTTTDVDLLTAIDTVLENSSGDATLVRKLRAKRKEVADTDRV